MFIKWQLLLYCFVLIVFVHGLGIREVFTDKGRNLTVQCPLHQTEDVMWVREGKEQISRFTVLDTGSLFLEEVDEDDGGLYSCLRQNVVNEEKALINVSIRTPPPPLVNVTVQPSTVLALILWNVNGTGGYPIINFTAEYRLASGENKWIAITPNHITPNSRQIDVYHLRPNTTYEFRVWATNQLGRSEATQVVSTTIPVYKEEELARHFLAGADQFDTRIWAAAVGIVMGTLILLGMGMCYLLYREFHFTSVVDEQEIIEMVPNIILNPGFEGNESIPADENCNNETLIRLNNNTVVQPRQM